MSNKKNIRVASCSACLYVGDKVGGGGMIYFCPKHQKVETWNEAMRCEDFKETEESKSGRVKYKAITGRDI